MTTVAPSEGTIHKPAPVFPHIRALDGLRGFAVVLVLFHHLLWSNPNTGNRLFDFVSAVRGSAYIGVNVFFVLSGFLITNILLNAVNSEGYFKNFYARRALRIFPLYYGLLIVMLCLTKPLHLVWNGWQYYLLTYTSNQVFWTRPPLILPHLTLDHFWTLQVEEQFYFVWPLVVYRVRRLKTLIITALTGCLVVLLIRIVITANMSRINNIYLAISPTECCADALLFGCCLAAVLRTRYRDIVLKQARWVFLGTTLILLCVAKIHGSIFFEGSTFIPTIGFTIIDLACVSMLAMAIQERTVTNRIFSSSPLRFLGKYSYGIYVFHYPLWAMMGMRSRRLIMAHTGSKLLGVVGPGLIIATVTLIVAMISFNTYESFFLRLKRYFQ